MNTKKETSPLGTHIYKVDKSSFPAKYSLDFAKGYEHFAPPKTLFRYFGLNAYGVKNFNEATLFASQPDTFNDLFDASEHLLDFNSLPPQWFRDFYQDEEYMKMGTLPNAQKSNIVRQARAEFYAFLMQKYGIICMSGTINNELLWGYYNNHKGFAIEYEHTLFPNNFSEPFKINYREKLEKIKMHKHKYIETSFFVFNTIKKRLWELENEYRVIVTPTKHGSFITSGRFNNESSSNENESRIQNCNLKSIKSITLGFLFFNFHQELKTSFENKAVIDLKENVSLKQSLLDQIIAKKIECRVIGFDDNTFEFTLEVDEFEKLDENRYLVTRHI